MFWDVISQKFKTIKQQGFCSLINSLFAVFSTRFIHSIHLTVDPIVHKYLIKQTGECTAEWFTLINHNAHLNTLCLTHRETMK